MSIRDEHAAARTELGWAKAQVTQALAILDRFNPAGGANITDIRLMEAIDGALDSLAVARQAAGAAYSLRNRQSTQAGAWIGPDADEADVAQAMADAGMLEDTGADA